MKSSGSIAALQLMLTGTVILFSSVYGSGKKDSNETQQVVRSLGTGIMEEWVASEQSLPMCHASFEMLTSSRKPLQNSVTSAEKQMVESQCFIVSVLIGAV